MPISDNRSTCRSKMAKKSVRYAVIDAFTDAPFKGNPAAVCLLEPEEAEEVDEKWMQLVAAEFNLSETCFLTPLTSGLKSDHGRSNGGALNPARFNLRWFTPVAEVDLCGHATLAAAHFLLTSGLVDCDIIEFVTKSGLLMAKKGPQLKHLSTSNLSGIVKDEVFSVELDFPVISVIGCAVAETPSIPETLNGASIVNVQKTHTAEDFIVELATGKDILCLQPNFDELQKCTGRGVIVTAPAPAGSGFDFFTRFFCPKLGINEDPVCGSAHCALAPYWSRKLGKESLVAYMASPRGGRLDLRVEEETQRVYIQGEAVTVMEGTLLV